MKSAKANIKKQKSGILVLKEKNAMSYLAYEPLDINNWMLCYLVPQSKAQEEFQFIGNKEVILFAVIGVGVITFFILIFQRTSMKQKKMREIASRDGLTQLYNKAGTEQEKLYKKELLFYTNELRGKGLCTSPKRLYSDQ